MTHRPDTIATTGQDPGKVLVVGADGGIGRALMRALAQHPSVWGSSRRPADGGAGRRLHIDLADAPATWELPPTPADVAFLCAAVTSQDRCRIAPDETRHVNVTRTVALARQLAQQGTFVVFLSTSLVLAGAQPMAPADAPPRPVGDYALQKAEAEQQLLALQDRCAIVRLAKVITPDLPLLQQWISCLRAGVAIAPFDDMVMAPLSLQFAVDVLLRVALQRRAGVHQASAAREMSYAHAASLIARQLHADPALVQPRSFRSMPHVTAPPHAVLDTSALGPLGLHAPAPEEAFSGLVLQPRLQEAS